MPSYQTAGAAGFDLAASADVTVAPGAIVAVPWNVRPSPCLP